MNRRDLFLARPDVQTALEKAGKKVAIARGKISVLAKPNPETKRRQLLKSFFFLGFCGAALLAGTSVADATIVFENVLFKATGATTDRAEKDRWSDIKNVKDFGASGNGIVDDTIAFQATVDWTGGANRGRIFVPLGTYNVTAPITLNFDGELSFILQGCGNGSTISGNFNGFILDRSNNNATGGIRVIEGLRIVNSNTGTSGGAIRMFGTTEGMIRDCSIQGFRGIDGGDSSELMIIGCALGSLPGPPTNSIGILIDGDTWVYGCDVTGWDHGIRMFGPGNCIVGGRMEVNKTAIMLGMDGSGSTNGTSGHIISGISFESNGITLDYLASGYGTVMGCTLQAPGVVSDGSRPSKGIRIRNDGSYGETFSSLTINGAWTIASIEILDGSNLGGNTFIGLPTVANSSSSIAPVTVTINTSTDFVTDTAHGLATDSVVKFTTSGSFVGYTSGTAVYVINPTANTYQVSLTKGGSAINFTTASGTISRTVAGDVWIMPTFAHTAKFINCNNPAPEVVFANLPTGVGNVVNGDEYDISDCNTSTFLATVAGGGSGAAAHRRVRWNAISSIWQVVG